MSIPGVLPVSQNQYWSLEQQKMDVCKFTLWLFVSSTQSFCLSCMSFIDILYTHVVNGNGQSTSGHLDIQGYTAWPLWSRRWDDHFYDESTNLISGIFLRKILFKMLTRHLNDQIKECIHIKHANWKSNTAPFDVSTLQSPEHGVCRSAR